MITCPLAVTLRDGSRASGDMSDGACRCCSSCIPSFTGDVCMGCYHVDAIMWMLASWDG